MVEAALLDPAEAALIAAKAGTGTGSDVSSKLMILNEAMEVEPGWVEIIPLNLVTLHVLTWLSSAHTETKSSSDNLTLLILDRWTVKV